MKSGRLIHRVTFQRRSRTANAFGEQVETWTDVATVWGGIEPIAGREFFASQQVQSEVTTRIVCRHSLAIAEVTVADRIVHDSVAYDIRSMINVNTRGREVQFMCTAHSIS